MITKRSIVAVLFIQVLLASCQNNGALEQEKTISEPGKAAMKNAAVRFRQLRSYGTLDPDVIKKLETLSLSRTDFGDPDVYHLKNLSNIKVLSLNETPLTDKGVQQLVSYNLPLESLNLSGTRITCNSLAFLEKQKNLRTLELNQTAVSDGCISSIERMSNLRILWIEDSKVSRNGYEKRKRPK